MFHFYLFVIFLFFLFFVSIMFLNICFFLVSFALQGHRSKGLTDIYCTVIQNICCPLFMTLHDDNRGEKMLDFILSGVIHRKQWGENKRCENLAM